MPAMPKPYAPATIVRYCIQKVSGNKANITQYDAKTAVVVQKQSHMAIRVLALYRYDF